MPKDKDRTIVTDWADEICITLEAFTGSHEAVHILQPEALIG